MAISEELQRRIAGFTGMNVDPMTGSISNQEMSDFNQMSATNAMDMVEKNLPFYGSQKMVDPRDLAKPQPFMSSGEPFTEDMLQKLGVGQTKGAISDAEMQVLEQAQVEAGETFTPEEKEMALQKIRELSQKSEAPLFEQAEQLRMEGEGDDTEIGHLKPGEVILDPQMLEDPQFEQMVQRKFDEFGVPIEVATVGGLNSINPVTGVAQFGFLKKVGKFLKKVVAPIAKVAQFVPGPWMAPAAIIAKADTVRNVVRGDANPLSLLTVAGPLAVGGKLTDNIAGIKAAGDGSFLKGLGSLGGKTVSSIGNAVMNPIDAIRGIPSLLSGANMTGNNPNFPTDFASTPADAMMDYQKALKLDPSLANNPMATLTGGMTPDQIANMGVPNMGVPNPSNVMDYDQMIAKMAGGMSGQPQTETEQGTQQGTQTGKQPTMMDRLSGAISGTSGGLGNLGDLARIGVTGGLAGALAKLAYDETNKDTGVPLTPLTQMDATGRYNIEAEVARRMGQQAPNPVEFGLLPANTFPQLSGGQPMQARYGGEVMGFADGGSSYPNKGLEALAQVAPQVVDRMGYNHGGMVMPMAYAEGGNVAMEDFNRMNGGINGIGTETSDDIPAMLSDGEFVMTGQAVRGAGKYEMQAGEGGIMTLIPSLEEDRERGTNLMYSMMDAFAGQAVPSQG